MAIKESFPVIQFSSIIFMSLEEDYTCNFYTMVKNTMKTAVHRLKNQNINYMILGDKY